MICFLHNSIEQHSTKIKKDKERKKVNVERTFCKETDRSRNGKPGSCFPIVVHDCALPQQDDTYSYSVSEAPTFQNRLVP